MFSTNWLILVVIVRSIIPFFQSDLDLIIVLIPAHSYDTELAWRFVPTGLIQGSELMNKSLILACMPGSGYRASGTSFDQLAVVPYAAREHEWCTLYKNAESWIASRRALDRDLVQIDLLFLGSSK